MSDKKRKPKAEAEVAVITDLPSHDDWTDAALLERPPLMTAHEMMIEDGMPPELARTPEQDNPVTFGDEATPLGVVANAIVGTLAQAVTPEAQTDAETVTPDEATVKAAEIKKAKARGRAAKTKVVKADREAAKKGKRWDAKRCAWVDPDKPTTTDDKTSELTSRDAAGKDSTMTTKATTTKRKQTLSEGASALATSLIMSGKAKAKGAPAKAAGKASKTTARANARTRVEASEPTGTTEKIGKLASRANGASRAELIELSGWSQQAWKWFFMNSKGKGFCQKFGYKLEVLEGKDGEARYKITKS